MDFFADRNLGRYNFPDELRAAGIVVHVHEDHFARDAPDDQWLPEVARRGWVVLSADKHIMRNPLELDAVMLSRAVLLVLVGGDMSTAETWRATSSTPWRRSRTSCRGTRPRWSRRSTAPRRWPTSPAASRDRSS